MKKISIILFFFLIFNLHAGGDKTTCYIAIGAAVGVGALFAERMVDRLIKKSEAQADAQLRGRLEDQSRALMQLQAELREMQLTVPQAPLHDELSLGLSALSLGTFEAIEREIPVGTLSELESLKHRVAQLHEAVIRILGLLKPIATASGLSGQPVLDIEIALDMLTQQRQ